MTWMNSTGGVCNSKDSPPPISLKANSGCAFRASISRTRPKLRRWSGVRPSAPSARQVVGRRIAAVMLPAVAGVLAGVFHHHPVARHLGDDRSRGDRAAFGVAVDDRFRRPLPARSRIAVDQHPGRFEPQRLDRARHRQHPRPVNVDAVDLLDRSQADAPGRALHQLAVERLALLQRQFLANRRSRAGICCGRECMRRRPPAPRAARTPPRRHRRAAAENRARA